MKYTWFLTALFLIILTSPHSARAFSEDHGAAINSDGTAKFSDPDEQQPAFMTAPEGASTRETPLTLGMTAPTTMPMSRDNDTGAQAFDQAFAHQQKQ